ncbi:uncharacterized protein LOC101850765 [Aplysia californica]|uniref:Uncharacterized protein LOC101850765 n=1 Tax=Aplysia californica TaxID=6500 RepID=A0ABM0K8T6_APLCA|nr:uncharacterized protein LOC101850765 [Aplysia californica]
MVSFGALPCDATPTAEFVERFDQLFNCFNSGCLNSKSAMGHTITSNSRHEAILRDTQVWLGNIVCKNKTKTLPCLEGWKLSTHRESDIQLWQHLKEDCGFKFLTTSRLNQDRLENMFSVIRGKGGHRVNPDPMEFRLAFRQTIVDAVLVTGDTKNSSVEEIKTCSPSTEWISFMQCLSSDEMVGGFKGHWMFKQFNAMKPKKYHIKSFGICDAATGYVYNLLTYFGTDTSYNPDTDVNSGQAIKVFDPLLTGLVKRHHIFADHYYTTRALIDSLLQIKKFYYTGTVNINRVGFPSEFKTVKLIFKETKFFTNEDSSIVSGVVFPDKKAKQPVAVASKPSSTELISKKDVDKPVMIDEYNT